MSMLTSAVCWPAPAIPKLLADPDVDLTNDEITWIVASLYIGNLISPIPGGHFMDRFGRKTTLLCSSFFTMISWVMMYFATSPYQFYVARFLSGLSNGVTHTITATFIGEISEAKLRGSIGNLMSILVSVTSLYMYSIGPYISYDGLIYATSIIPVVFVLTFVWVPETPYYYVMKNRHDKAVESLTWYRCDKTDDDIMNELFIIDTHVKEQMKSKRTFKSIISNRGNRRAIIIVQYLAGLQRFCGMGALMTYSPLFIPERSIPFLTVNQCVTLLGVTWFITPLISTLFVDTINRRTLLMISCTGCGVVLMVATIWYYLDEQSSYGHYTKTFIWIPYATFLCHAIFYSIGIGPLGSSIRGELFASNIKGKASAISTIVMAVVSFFIGKFFLTIADHYGMYVNFLFFTLSCILSNAFVYLYMIETKGKTLEQIQDELNDTSTVKKNITKI